MLLQWSLCLGQTCSDESPEPRFCIPVNRKTQTHKHEQILRQLHTTHSQIHSCQCWDTDAETHILRHSHRKPIIFLYWRGLFVLANDVVRSCWASPRIVKWLMLLQWSLCLGQTCSDEWPEQRFCIPVNHTQTHNQGHILKQKHIHTHRRRHRHCPQDNSYFLWHTGGVAYSC